MFIFQVYLKITANLYHIKNSQSIHPAIDWFMYNKIFAERDFRIGCRLNFVSRNTNADLKISPYVRVHIKVLS